MLCAIVTLPLAAHEPIDSSVTTYYENTSFKNSVQKTQGNRVGVGGDIHVDASEYKFVYEYANTQTKQPPLRDDLRTEKLYLRYSYKFENALSLNANYINVLSDNIAPTAHTVAYGLGAGYEINKASLNFTQYYADYQEFNTYQSDFKIDYKTKIDEVGVKFTSISHYIHLDNYTDNGFSKKADEDYFTTGLKLHAHYKSYHFGSAAYFGKRVFAVMDEGFKIQHHAMEFDRTYAVGIGKSFSDFVLRFQYIYQRAKELPADNENVQVQNLRVIANYKF